MKKPAFPHECMNDYDNISHVRPVEYKNFYSKLKGGSMITKEEHNEFVREFHSRGCMMMMDWLRVYNEADLISFTKAVGKI